MTRPGRSVVSRAAARAGLVLLGLAAALLSAEACVRLSGFEKPLYASITPPNRGTSGRFELVPGSEEWSGGVQYRINSRGYRDAEYPLKKPPGVFRVLVVGSCVAFGHRVPLYKTFAKRLERMLKRKNGKGGKRFEVINGGVPGFLTHKQVARFRESGIRYEPDLIVLHWALKRNMWNHIRPLQPKWIQWVREGAAALLPGRSYLAWYLHGKADAYRADGIWGGLMERRGGWSGHIRRCYSDGSADWKREKRSIGELLDLAAGRGIPVVVAIFPWLDRLDGGHPYLPIYESVAGLAVEHGAVPLVLFESFRGLDPEDVWISLEDRRPNEYAHSLIAPVLYETIVKAGLLRVSR